MSESFMIPLIGSDTDNKKIEKLVQSSFSISGGNGTGNSASYTFQKDCLFCAVFAQANRWTDTNLGNIGINSLISKQAEAVLNPYHTQNSGAGVKIMTGTAKKGGAIYFYGTLRADGSQTATFHYTVFAI